MNPFIKYLIGLTFVLAFVQALTNADGNNLGDVQSRSIPSEVTLYFWEDDYKKSAGPMPSQYKETYTESLMTYCETAFALKFIYWFIFIFFV